MAAVDLEDWTVEPGRNGRHPRMRHFPCRYSVELSRLALLPDVMLELAQHDERACVDAIEERFLAIDAALVAYEQRQAAAAARP